MGILLIKYMLVVSRKNRRDLGRIIDNHVN